MKYLALVAACLAAAPALAPAPEHGDGFKSITEDDLEAHLIQLCTAPLEGRDTPSAGLTRAAAYIAAEFEELGLTPPEGAADYYLPFSQAAQVPVPEESRLSVRIEGAEEARTFDYGAEFVPAPYCGGRGEGPPVFVGFGISSKKEKYDDLKGDSLKGAVAVILEGEPRHRKRFDGPEVTSAADLYSKLSDLYREKVEGVIVVRREPEDDGAAKARDRPEPATLGFRHTWASWASDRPRTPPGIGMPVVEVSHAVAAEILGFDLEPLAAKIDRSGKPIRKETEGRTVSVASMAREGQPAVDNVVGLLAGSDPALADEYVIVGAHYDHVGVDMRGRIGYGADDNASGTAGMLEIAGALAAAQPRRSVLLCAFAGEEDGLNGSRALAQRLPVPRDAVVAMINLDMIGRGDAAEVAVLGIVQNPDLEKVLDRAKRLKSTRVKKVVVRQGEHLFTRSDHFSFHEIGIPVLFFFEGLPETQNKDYHTWRDTIDKLDLDKMERTSRLAYNAAWLLANDDDRPPAPRD